MGTPGEYCMQHPTLNRLPGPIYQVTYQLKILSAALLMKVFLNRSLSWKRWLALVLLAVGVT